MSKRNVHYHARDKQTIRRVSVTDWPEAGIMKDDICTVQLGPVEVGQLISIIYRKSLLINRLIEMREDGAITVEGASGKRHTLEANTVKIEGPVTDIQRATKKSARVQRITITNKYYHADLEQGGETVEIQPGDVCTVRVGAPYKDGDLVLIVCTGILHCCQRTPHHHALYYQLVTGKKFKFALRSWRRTSGGRYFKEGAEEGLILGPVLKVIKKGEKASPTQPKKRSTLKRGTLETYTSGFDCSLYGIHDDDDLIVEIGGKIKLGDLVLVKKPDEEDDDNAYFSRVCLISGDVVRVCGTYSHHKAHDEPRDRIIGPMVKIEHTDCKPAKIEALRARLAKIDTDDITNCTAALKLEREIYDLEHPKVKEVEDGSESEWPDIIGGGNEL